MMHPRPSSDTQTDAAPSVLRLERARLEVVAGPDLGLSLDFHDRVRVGSQRVAQLVLSDPRVSGLHCEVTLRDGLWLRDLGSKNGTLLGGFRIREAALPPRVTFTVGRTSLRVDATGEMVELPLHDGPAFFGLPARSARMSALVAQLARVAPTESTVLVLGETGVGKERVVRALHAASGRAQGPLVVVDCGAVPYNLMESELYGHERGAFTGASDRVEGAFTRAGGGTLFLDEVGELPLELQTRLLRVLSGGEVTPLGGGASFRPDVRVVAATHRDLAIAVSRGRFREDLYHRLAVIVLDVPPLRERLEDLPALAIEIARDLGHDPVSVLSPEVMRGLLAYDWPGNVRELSNVLERAVTLSEVPRPGDDGAKRAGLELTFPVELDVPLAEARARLVDSFEATYVRALLDISHGNVSAAARQAGVDRMTLHRMIRRHRIRGSGRRGTP
jgi:DNA-binding NtrC family response regulator